MHKIFKPVVQINGNKHPSRFPAQGKFHFSLSRTQHLLSNPQNNLVAVSSLPLQQSSFHNCYTEHNDHIPGKKTSKKYNNEII